MSSMCHCHWWPEFRSLLLMSVSATFCHCSMLISVSCLSGVLTCKMWKTVIWDDAMKEFTLLSLPYLRPIICVPVIYHVFRDFSSVLSLSRVRLFVTSWIAARQASLSITISWSSLKRTSIESVMPSSHLILSRPLLLLPPIPPSIRVFSDESTLHMRWQCTGVSALTSFLPKNTQCWSPSEWTGWISLQSKGLPRVFSRHHSSKASILRCSAFFTVQLSHPYMTTGKTIALTKRTFVGKVMLLLFNMLSRLVII